MNKTIINHLLHLLLLSQLLSQFLDQSIQFDNKLQSEFVSTIQESYIHKTNLLCWTNLLDLDPSLMELCFKVLIRRVELFQSWKNNSVTENSIYFLEWLLHLHVLKVIQIILDLKHVFLILFENKFNILSFQWSSFIKCQINSSFLLPFNLYFSF